MKRVLVVLLAVFAVLSVVVFTGCKAKGGDMRFMYWGSVEEIQIIKEMVDKFQKDTKVTVSAERAPSGPPYMEKVLTQFAGGSAPDVLFVEANNFKEFAEKGVLEDLTPYLNEETTMKIGDFYPEIIKRFTIDGKLFVLPRDIAPICVVYYNKKMFDEAGVKYPKDDWTWADMLKTAKKLTKKDANGMTTVFGFVDDWPIWETFVFSNGGSMVDNVERPTKCTLDKKAAIEAVQFRADLINKYHVSPSPSQMTGMGGMGTADMFISGRVAMFFSGIWKTPTFRAIQNFEWDVVTFPSSKSSNRGYASGGSGYAIVKTAKDKKAAWKLVTYLAGVEGQKKLAATGLAQPAMKAIAESPAFLDGKAPKHKDIVLKAVKYAKFSPRVANWDEINVSMIAPAFDKIWNGKEDANTVLKELVPQINENYFSE
ncbi:MAG: sugar ABC transporter substrate-binding protein [Spirochaetia bacterium]|nr:sugar ABC transporter substrate-binding protein [Spirochaetia bacterium]